VSRPTNPLRSHFPPVDALPLTPRHNFVRCADRSAVAADAFLEPRYSVYGNNDKGWASLAKWYRLHAVDKTTKTLLAVQLPRVYPIWRKLGMVQNFGEVREG